MLLAMLGVILGNATRLTSMGRSGQDWLSSRQGRLLEGFHKAGLALHAALAQPVRQLHEPLPCTAYHTRYMLRTVHLLLGCDTVGVIRSVL